MVRPLSYLPSIVMPKVHYPYVVSVDWIQVYGLLHSPLETLKPKSFSIKVEDYPTAQFLRRSTISYEIDGRIRVFAHILHQARTSVIKENACQIKVINEQLYTAGWVSRLRSMIQELNIEYKSISRLDICADFNKLYKGLHPLTLIKGYLTQKYLKIGINQGYVAFKSMGYLISNQTKSLSKNFSLGTQEYNGVTWGSKGYVQTQLYNKTQELRDKGTKPWIVEQWINAGLDINNVWRLEFRIQKAGKSLELMETGDIFSLGLSEISDEHRFLELFQSYVDKYARFVKRDYHVKKQQMTPIILFSNLTDFQISIKRKIHTNQFVSMRTPNVLRKSLDDIKEKVTNREFLLNDPDYIYHIERVQSYLMQLFPYAFSEKKDKAVTKFMHQASMKTILAGKMLKEDFEKHINKSGKRIEQDSYQLFSNSDELITPIIIINQGNRAKNRTGNGPKAQYPRAEKSV